MRSLIGGIVLIVLGLGMGDSVLQGHFGITSLFFDGLGLFWIVKGGMQIYKEKQQA